MNNNQPVSSGISQWLQEFDDKDRKKRIWDLGLLAGWRQYPDGSYGAPNFERALVLDRLVELHSPADILEIGTGRGLGSLTVKLAAKNYGYNVKVTSIDLIAQDHKQEWAIQIDGENKVIEASRDQVWAEYIDPKLPDEIRQIAGLTTRALPRLAKEGESFDLIFIDGGHDVHSVVHDLSYSIAMLKPGGMILMDDFAPLDEYGIGTVIAVNQAYNWFDNVEVFRTEGLVFGGAEHSGYPRGMALLSGLKNSDPKIAVSKFIFWKFLKVALWFAYLRRSFPLK